MPISPRDIEEKVFSVVHVGRGYAQHEVDDFLDSVRDELARAQAAASAAAADVQRLLGRQAASETVQISAVPADGSSAGPAAAAPVALPVEASIAKILQSGQRIADEAVAEAKVEAEKIKAAAQVEAENLKTQALAEAERAKADLQAEVEAAQAASLALGSANDVAAKILQNALAALKPPAAE